MGNVMVDIETLGTKSTSVVLSIGAVEFDERQLGREFYRRVNIDSCIKHGLTVDGRTIEWWMDQSEEARTMFQYASIDLATALREFSETFSFEGEVWANGVSFDMPILENAFHAVGLPIPWLYYNVRDYRTVKYLAPREVLTRVRVDPTTKHHALEDAKAQALTLMGLLEYRREGRLVAA